MTMRGIATVERTLAVTLCAPAVRSVVLRAEAEYGDGGNWSATTQVYPVLAIQAEVVRCFEKRYTPVDERAPPNDTMSERDLFEDGWQLVEQRVDRTILIYDPETGLRGGGSHPQGPLSLGSRVLERVACCTWSVTDDDQRLAPLRAQLEADLLEMLRERDELNDRRRT
jgi:hypothetical protein